ncbi:hypothetical protein UJ101_02443 [Flavobacteriaceae bacterium UJ101]|nr:hypothetical protein UJ101_02443 [Flavobacteriaceae bacterium UJ101]
MKINNKRIKSYIQSIYLIIGLLFALFLITKLFPIRAFAHIPINIFPIIGLILLVITRYRGNQLFEYDSDGEALNFKNEDIVLSNFIASSKKSSEFPKRKLVSYKVKNSFLKRTLEITITSKKSSTGFTKLKYDISYLKKTEIKGIKKSLDKVLEENKNV